MLAGYGNKKQKYDDRNMTFEQWLNNILAVSSQVCCHAPDLTMTVLNVFSDSSIWGTNLRWNPCLHAYIIGRVWEVNKCIFLMEIKEEKLFFINGKTHKRKYTLHWENIIDQGSPQILAYMLMIILFSLFNTICSFLNDSMW